ncbi:MAG: Ig-like domain repeat protein [Betaproteobacteria bacterium]
MRLAIVPAATRILPLARAFAALCVTFAMLPLAVYGHQGADQRTAASALAPTADAKSMTVEGHVGAIIVTNRMTGQTHRYPVLDVVDRERFLLRNAGSLPTGANVAVTGRAETRVLYSDSVRMVAAATMGKAAPQRAELTGTLRMFHIDFVDGRPAEFGYSLVTDAGRTNIVDLGALLPALENGMRATISGPADARGYITVDTIEILGPPAGKPKASAADAGPPQAVTTGYTVVPLKYPNNASAPFTYNADPGAWPIATITTTVLGAAPAQSTAEYYKEVSFGAQLVNGAVAHLSNAWLQADAPRPGACGTNAELDAVLASIETQGNAKALAAGFNTNARPGILYVIDSLPSCGWAGLGYIGWERAYTNGTAALWVVGHELGHNFGLYHAGSLDCGAATILPIAPSGCSVTEYGDPFDIMGNQRPMHLAAYQKLLLGYIAGGTVATHSAGSTEYTLQPIELAGQAQYAVRVPTGVAERTYWIEFRQPIGFDSGLSAFPNLGAQVRLARPFEWNNCGGCAGTYDDTQFLDMTPATPAFTDGALTSGNTYTDSLHNITFEVTSATTSAMKVKVTVGGSMASTTTTLASSVNPSTPGQSVTFTATVTGSAPTGTVAFRESGTPLTGCAAVALTGSGNTRTAACTTTTLAVGVHSIVAEYSGNAGNALSTSSPLSQSVKTATTTTLASSANPSVAGNSVTFTATVTGNAPTGAVAFTDNGATLTGCGAVNLVGSGNSRTAACTAAALSTGTHPIVASYAGNAANGASTSTTLSQVVSSPGPTASSTTLASSSNPAVIGATVTFTATVNGSNPTGTVAFTANGAGIAGCGAVSLVGAGNTRSAACATAVLAIGMQSIVASYGGNGGNTASASAPLVQFVNDASVAPTTTTVTSSANPAPSGATATLRATVVANPPVAGGTVTFTANGNAVGACTGVPVVVAGAAREATCTPSGLGSGAYSIVASYSGETGAAPSTSKVYSQVISNPQIGNTLQFAAATYAVNETTGTVAVKVTRLGDVAAAASVQYAIGAGTAAAGSDFTPGSGTLSWPAGDSLPRTIVIPIANDSAQEANETFAVTLSNPVAATLGAVSSTTVTILDDDSAPLAMPGVATVVANPYGTLSVQGGTQNGNTITNLQKNAVIQLGTTPGAPGTFAQIDFQGLAIGAGNTLTIRSGAATQTVHVNDVSGQPAGITGALLAQGGNGAAAPYLYVQNAAGLNVNAGGVVTAAAGLTMDALGASWTTGQTLVNQGTIDGGSSLQLFAAKVNGGGAFLGNAIVLATFGNLNNPVNGPHYLANGLQLGPSSGNNIGVTLAGYGNAPQVVNLMLGGNATVSMPSAWPNGSILPPNNRPVLPGEVRAAGIPDPSYGGGSMIVQAAGSLTLQGGASGDFVFPGGLVFKAGGALDVKGTAIDNAWTTSGAVFQGVFLEASSITDSAASARVSVRTNNLNWANFDPRPLVPVSAWTLQRMPNGTAQFVAADNAAPHLNFYSITSEAGAAGACFTCLTNMQVIDFSTAP